MLINEVTRLIRQRLSEKSAQVSRDLGAGAAADHAAYKFMCGKLRGHQDALEAIDEVMTNLNEDDDD